MTLYKWSQTASADATADSTINWMEGQAPSSVNDSARAMMAAIAKYRDDVAGAIVTGGTSTSYTLNSYQVFQSLAQMSGQVVAFTPHATNGATVTLNVDSLGARPLRSAPNAELPAGVLVQGTPYAAVYNSSDAVFYLHGFFVSPHTIPIGASIDYWGSSAPNSSFVLAYGQAISRTIYATLFSLFSTTYGSGDGSTTFNVPDLRGRVIAGRDDMGGSAASRLSPTYFGGTATSLGAVGGSESHTLTTVQMPSHGHTASVTDPGHTHPENIPYPGGGSTYPSTVTSAASSSIMSPKAPTDSAITGISVTNSNTGGGGAHNNVQPTIIANRLIRII